MDQKIITVFMAVALIATPAIAAKIEMTCKNPRQGYSVTFDDTAKTFMLGAPGADTPYTVERVKKGKDGTVVHGKTVKDGPNFVAYLDGRRRIAFVDGGQVVQTDPCKWDRHEEPGRGVAKPRPIQFVELSGPKEAAPKTSAYGCHLNRSLQHIV